jgi:DNA-directed RNA polymerase delta subunit
MGTEKEEVQTKSIENILNKIIAEKFPNLGKDMINKVQETFGTPNKQEQKRISALHIIIKVLSI